MKKIINVLKLETAQVSHRKLINCCKQQLGLVHLPSITVMHFLSYIGLNPCTLPADRGDCFASVVRYFYNSITQRCEVFYWGGCSGNENRFNYLHECERQCSGKNTITIQFIVP